MEICRHYSALALMSALLAGSPGLGSDAPADAAWKKVDEAIKAAGERQPAGPAALKIALESYDGAAGEFLRNHPGDARRWRILFFDAASTELRQRAALPAKAESAKVMPEILRAADADAETKADASAVLVLLDHRDLPKTQNRPAWLRRAEEHLRSYPVHPANLRIRSCVEQVRAMVERGGKPVDLKFTATDGRKVDLSTMRGKVVLVHVWESSCDLCAAGIPEILAAHRKYGAAGFEVIGISVDKDRGEAERCAAGREMSWPQFQDGRGWDGELVKSLGVHYTPTLWLIDPAGLLVSTDPKNHLEELVDKYLREQISGKRRRGGD